MKIVEFAFEQRAEDDDSVVVLRVFYEARWSKCSVCMRI